MSSSIIHLSPTSPKSIKYQTNGSGRDTYIYYNNGGISKDGFAINHKIQDTSNGNINTSQYLKVQQTSLINATSKNVHYVSDGTGRDGYIKYNDGGFSVNTSKRLNFLSSLRNYEQRVEPRDDDYFMRVQNQKSPREIKQTQMLQKLQVIQIEKLASPKYQKQKYIKQDSRLPTIRQKIIYTEINPSENKSLNRNYSLPALQLKNLSLNTDLLQNQN